MKQEIWHGDCLELMGNIPDGSVDLVLTDPPYKKTGCKWDSIIPFDPMWIELKRITKNSGAFVFFLRSTVYFSVDFKQPRKF